MTTTDDDDAGLAHQQELEARQWQEQLAADKAYLEWLDLFAQHLEDTTCPLEP